MDIDGFKDRGRYLLIVTVIIIAFSVIGVSLFQWLNSSSKESIADTFRQLNISIHKSLSYDISSSINKYQSNFIEYNGDDQAFKDNLVETLEKVNNEIGGDYISSVGYVSQDDIKYRYLDNNWTQLDQVFNKDIPLNFSDDDFLSDHLQFSIITEGKKRVFIVFYLDIEEYIKNIDSDEIFYIEGYELNWSFSKPENSQIVSFNNYIFHPFQRNSIKWIIGISKFIEFNRSGKERFFKDPNKDGNYIAYVEVLKNGESLVHMKQRELAILWVLYFVLLFGLALAFILILNQVRKLKDIRDREREFVASITHELRTPLAVINSAADNIKSGILTPKRTAQYGDLIINQSKRLSDMIEGVLLFSRFEGKVERKPKLSSLTKDQLINSINQLSEVVEKEFNRKLKVDLSIPNSFYTDKESLELILSNLILNSAKHAYSISTPGEIRVKAHLKHPDKMIFIVEDDGIGIQNKEKKSIFKPFFRGEHSHKNQINGSGLGLFLTHKKIELLGGNISLESPYPRIDGVTRSGCRFRVELEVGNV